MKTVAGRHAPSAIIAFALIASAAGMLCGQTTGDIHLTVKDPSGAAMQATGTLSGPATRNFKTDAQGSYDLPNLPYGRYNLQLSGAGFATQTVQINVSSATPVAEAVTMALASQTNKVDVVATTPLGGTAVSVDQVPGAVQTVTSQDMENSGALDLADLANRRLNGVYLNEMQGNPFQPDVNFRGYTASPLLGTPEGISVYLDGVRQNQPFGDVVSWDLIPKNAISEATLMPGSNPLFGLNTLGGALSVTTKDGVSSPGLEASMLYGASNRKQEQLSYGGGKSKGFSYFAAGNLFHESGWRFDSPSDVRQGFVRLGWRTEKSDIGLTFSYADNTLIGNGLQDYRLLDVNYSSVYSIPDSTVNRSPALNLIVRHTFTPSITFSGNGYYRHIRTNGINANYNTDILGNNIYQPNASEQAALNAAGYTGYPTSGANATNTPFPSWRCIAEALMDADVDERCDGIDIYSTEIQNDYGFAGQFNFSSQSGDMHNQLTIGASIGRGSVDYIQNSQYGYVNSLYVVIPVSAWQDGSATVNPVDSRVNLYGTTPNWSGYVTDTFQLAKNLTMTASGRYNSVNINNLDRLNPIAGPGSLDGNYTYRHLNPAIGFTWSPLPAVSAYASWSMSSRAPTSIELGCADPANPCSLPNALSSDPPLQQVISYTWEAGLRGRPEVPFIHNFTWNFGAYRSENTNDILFVSSVVLGTGYFQNFARTQREGFDASLGGRVGPVNIGLNWTFLEATYQSPAVVDGSSNNASDSALSGFPGLDGNLYVQPGDRIPLIPKQMGKAYLEYVPFKKLTVNLSELAVSSSYARGNENNAFTADGVYYLGSGVSPGYAVTNFNAHYDLTKHIQVGVEIDNLFNREYYTSAQLANTVLTAQGTVQSKPFPAYGAGPEDGNTPVVSTEFLSPGAPRRAWAELRFRF